MNKHIFGECLADGSWAFPQKEPYGHSVEHIVTGKYKISHNIGKVMNIGGSLLGKPGMMSILDNGKESFTIHITVDGVLTDMPFSFVLSESMYG